MEVVARRAGVGVGTLYRHFPTKGDLLGDLVAEQFTGFRDHALAALESDVDPWEALAGTLRANALLASENLAVQNALTGSEVNWERVEPVRDELLAATEELIRRCHAAGAVRDDLEVADIPTVMCGLCSTMGAHAAGRGAAGLAPAPRDPARRAPGPLGLSRQRRRPAAEPLILLRASACGARASAA